MLIPDREQVVADAVALLRQEARPLRAPAELQDARADQLHLVVEAAPSGQLVRAHVLLPASGVQATAPDLNVRFGTHLSRCTHLRARDREPLRGAARGVARRRRRSRPRFRNWSCAERLWRSGGRRGGGAGRAEGELLERGRVHNGERGRRGGRPAQRSLALAAAAAARRTVASGPRRLRRRAHLERAAHALEQVVVRARLKSYHTRT